MVTRIIITKHDYAENIESLYLLYVYDTNLYGKAMCEHLPYIDIKLHNDILCDDVINTSDESDIGNMVEYDLSFPQQTHELLKQFVPGPENNTPNKEWCIDYQQEVQALTHAYIKTILLVAHLYERKNCKLHYPKLMFLLSLTSTVNNVEYGIIVDRIQYIMSFNLSPWVKPCILINNGLITNGKHEFAKRRFQLNE